MLGFNYVLVIQKKWHHIFNGINEKEFQTCLHPEYVNTLRMGDANLRFFITTVKDE
jgi:hypothetical protein